MISFFVTHNKSISIVGNKVQTCVVEFGSKFDCCNFDKIRFLKNIFNQRLSNTYQLQMIRKMLMMEISSFDYI